MKDLIDLAHQLHLLGQTHPNAVSSASFRLPGLEISLVRVAPGLSYSHTAESPSVVLMLDGTGTFQFDGWRATTQAGQLTDIAANQRFEVVADAEGPVALSLTRLVPRPPALEEKALAEEIRLAHPQPL